MMLSLHNPIVAVVYLVGILLQGCQPSKVSGRDSQTQYTTAADESPATVRAVTAIDSSKSTVAQNNVKPFQVIGEFENAANAELRMTDQSSKPVYCIVSLCATSYPSLAGSDANFPHACEEAQKFAQTLSANGKTIRPLPVLQRNISKLQREETEISALEDLLKRCDSKSSVVVHFSGLGQPDDYGGFALVSPKDGKTLIPLDGTKDWLKRNSFVVLASDVKPSTPEKPGFGARFTDEWSKCLTKKCAETNSGLQCLLGCAAVAGEEAAH